MSVGQYWYTIRHQLHVRDSCLPNDERIVLPTQLRQPVIDSLHLTHPGSVTMLDLCQHIWFPHIHRSMAQGCRQCTEQDRKNLLHPPNPPEVMHDLQKWSEDEITIKHRIPEPTIVKQPSTLDNPQQSSADIENPNAPRHPMFNEDSENNSERTTEQSDLIKSYRKKNKGKAGTTDANKRDGIPVGKLKSATTISSSNS